MSDHRLSNYSLLCCWALALLIGLPVLLLTGHAEPLLGGFFAGPVDWIAFRICEELLG